MSNSYSEKTPSSIYTRFNTRYVMHLLSYVDTLFEWSQMKIIKLVFPIFWYETIFYVKTSLLLLNFCLCVYMHKDHVPIYSWKRFVEFLERVQPTKTGLDIFYNKRPLEYAKTYPQPVDSWPRAKETPRDAPLQQVMPSHSFDCWVVERVFDACFVWSNTRVSSLLRESWFWKPEERSCAQEEL